MQVTRASDYAIRVMIQLASLPMGERRALGELAEATGAPESFLAKILQSLSRAALVASKRGKDGGFELMPRGQQASMRDVIEAIEGPLLLNLCLLPGETCDRKAKCQPHLAWEKAQQALLGVLEATKIADLVTPPAPTVQIEGADQEKTAE